MAAAGPATTRSLAPPQPPIADDRSARELPRRSPYTSRMDWLSLRKRLGGKPDSLGGRRREERARWLAETFPDLDPDVRPRPWRTRPYLAACIGTAQARPCGQHATAAEPGIPEWAEFDIGDACDLPAHIAKRRYDLVFANSVIEHVGGHERRERFADSVHQLSDAHWVQTPYRYFPIEPHWMVPGMQFMPSTVRAELARRWPLSYGRGKPRETMLRGGAPGRAA